MKQLSCSVLIILALITATLLNVRYLERFTHDLSQMLTEAQQLAEHGEADEAEKLTRQAQERFNAYSFYLHVTLSHRDIDNIETSFGEALEYLRLQETGSLYATANSNLLTQLQLLSESEQLTLKNLL